MEHAAAESEEAIARFLCDEKLRFLVRADPPWLVEARREGIVLALRPGNRISRRFHTVPPQQLQAFADAARRACEVLAKSG